MIFSVKSQILKEVLKVFLLLQKENLKGEICWSVGIGGKLLPPGDLRNHVLVQDLLGGLRSSYFARS